MSIERRPRQADEGRGGRKVTFPDGEVRHTSADPKVLARLIHMESRLAKAQAKIEAAGRNGGR